MGRAAIDIRLRARLAIIDLVNVVFLARAGGPRPRRRLGDDVIRVVAGPENRGVLIYRSDGNPRKFIDAELEAEAMHIIRDGFDAVGEFAGVGGSLPY